MVLPLFDHLIVWLISLFPNIADGVRYCHDSFQSLKRTEIVHDWSGDAEWFSCIPLLSEDPLFREMPCSVHEVAKSSTQYFRDIQWWDEWLEQPEFDRGVKQQLTSSLTLNSLPKSKQTNHSPYKSAGFIRSKKIVPAETELESSGRILARFGSQMSERFVQSNRSIRLSIGEFFSPWVRQWEFEEVESRTYREFFLPDQKIEFRRNRWQQGIQKVTAAFSQSIPFLKPVSVEVRRGIELTANFDQGCSNLIDSIFSFLKSVSGSKNKVPMTPH